MSDTKVYQFGTEGNASLNALLPFLQQRGIDPAILYNMGGNNGLFGNNGMEFLLLVVILAAMNGNGNGIFGGGGNNNSAEREMLMSAIQRNGTDLSQLAQTIGCSTARIHDAVGQVATQICNLAGQNAMSFQQVINALQAGNATLATQLASCCCELKGIMSEGFSSVGYALRDQTCNLEKAGSANTAAIIAKLDAIEDSRKDRELAEKDRVIATLTARSERQAELQPIYTALQEIQCNQPPVKKISCPEQYVQLNTGVNATYGLIPTCGCGFANGFGGYPFGFPFGFNNAF